MRTDLNSKSTKPPSGPKKNCATAIYRKARVDYLQGLAIGHFSDEWHKRFPMDEFDDLFFHLLRRHEQFLQNRLPYPF